MFTFNLYFFAFNNIYTSNYFPIGITKQNN